MGAIVGVKGMKLVPRQPRITIPSNDGLANPIVIEKADFTQEHAAQIIDFWKDLQKRDKTFDFDKAMTSTFSMEGDDDDDSGKAPESADLSAALEALEGMTVAQLKKFASDNGISLSDPSAVKADLLDEIVKAVKASV